VRHRNNTYGTTTVALLADGLGRKPCAWLSSLIDAATIAPDDARDNL